MSFKPINEFVSTPLPPFNIANITNYFITRVACDGRSARDFKHLNTRAFPLFKDGHVQNITASLRDKTVLFHASCLPEMKKQDTYTIELSQDKVSGDILTAICGCPAGCGPKGSCKHIAALCYALEEFNRIKKTPEYVSCTAKLQEWNQPRKRTLDPQNSEEIKFVKLEHGKVKRQHLNPAYDPRPPSLQHTSNSELLEFQSKLKSSGRPCGFLHVIPPASQSIAVAASSSTLPTLPPIPRSVREKVHAQVRKAAHPITLEFLLSLGKQFVDHITPNTHEATLIEQATQRQYACKRWHEERFARLTSSKFGEICKCRQPLNMCVKLLYPKSSSFSSSSLLWGRDHECNARDEYATTLQEGWAVK